MGKLELSVQERKAQYRLFELTIGEVFTVRDAGITKTCIMVDEYNSKCICSDFYDDNDLYLVLNLEDFIIEAFHKDTKVTALKAKLQLMEE